MIDFAQAWEPLRKNGYESLIPTVPGGKRPLGSVSRHNELYTCEPPEVELCEAWARQGRRAGVGFMAGPANSLLVIDSDYRHPAKVSRYLELREEHLGYTPLVVWGEAPKEKAFYAGATGTGTQIKVARTEIDIFGDGPSAKGYFIGFGLHPSGKQYTWEKATPLEVPRDDLPEVTADQLNTFLIAIASELGEAPRAVGNASQLTASGWKEQRESSTPAELGSLWRAQAKQVVAQGGRHMWMLETVASMVRHGFLPSSIYTFMQHHLLRHYQNSWNSSLAEYERELVEAIESATNKFFRGGSDDGDLAA
tara:strand:+ start:1111 stop:2037 length:927 start_codon:yes stop_codon:yes gene_type:complete